MNRTKFLAALGALLASAPLALAGIRRTASIGFYTPVIDTAISTNPAMVAAIVTIPHGLVLVSVEWLPDARKFRLIAFGTPDARILNEDQPETPQLAV